LQNASTVVQPSSLTQMVVLKLVQTWGLPGFLEHTKRTSAFYRERRDVMASCLDRYFNRQTTGTQRPATESTWIDTPPSSPAAKPAAEWIVPDASMFFWLKLHLPPMDSDDESVPGVASSSMNIVDFVRQVSVPRGILVLPGSSAFPDGRHTGCVRLAFSMLSDEEMDEGVKRLADAVRSLQSPAITGLMDGTGPMEFSEGAVVDAEDIQTVARDSGISIDKHPVELRRSDDLVVYPRGNAEENLDNKPLPPPPSAFSHYSSESSSTLHPLQSPVTTPKKKRESQPPTPRKRDSLLSIRRRSSMKVKSMLYPHSHGLAQPLDEIKASEEREMSSNQNGGDGELSESERLKRRLRRASSSIGLKIKSLARTTSTSKLGESMLKFKTSVVGMREKL